jgi:hypothetical protein
MQFGLYHPLEQGAWRKVSEDSGARSKKNIVRPFLLIDCTEGLSLPPLIDVVGDEYLQILSVSSI